MATEAETKGNYQCKMFYQSLTFATYFKRGMNNLLGLNRHSVGESPMTLHMKTYHPALADFFAAVYSCTI